MKIITLVMLAVVAGSVVASGAVPPVPSTPAAVVDIVYARPFTLHEGYTFKWRAEQPLVKEGYILVLKVNPDMVYPRQTAQPVLYVGDQTAERVNVGYESGHIIVIVPGRPDLKKTPIWFGTPALPERCTSETIAKERKAAEEAGIKPPAEARVAAATDQGGRDLRAADRFELRPTLARLVKKYAADESELADNLMVRR